VETERRQARRVDRRDQRLFLIGRDDSSGLGQTGEALIIK